MDDKVLEMVLRFILKSNVVKDLYRSNDGNDIYWVVLKEEDNINHSLSLMEIQTWEMPVTLIDIRASLLPPNLTKIEFNHYDI